VSNPRSITADAFEILVGRELRRIGVQPVQLRRRAMVHAPAGDGYSFELHGRLEAHGRRWSVLIECRNHSRALRKDDLHDLRARANAGKAASAILFTIGDIESEAAAAARTIAIPLLRVVDAQTALIATQVIQAGQMPAWLPEFTIELITSVGNRLLEANEPESLLREMRPPQ
jgi:hypothetical protein